MNRIRRSIGVLLLPTLACAPAGFLIQSVYPSKGHTVDPAYRSLPPREVESLFVRPFTDRPLLETSGVSSALLLDYAYLSRVNEGKAGAEEALEGMAERYVDGGISFRVVIWGKRMGDVDLTRFRFRLDLGKGRVLDPIRLEPVGSPVAEMRPNDENRIPIWHSLADLTFPVKLEPPLGKAVLLVEKGGLEYDRHTWRFDWR